MSYFNVKMKFLRFPYTIKSELDNILDDNFNLDSSYINTRISPTSRERLFHAQKKSKFLEKSIGKSGQIHICEKI